MTVAAKISDGISRRGLLTGGPVASDVLWTFAWIAGLLVVFFPLSFGSNAFVQASTMPGWLQAFVNVNPLSHLISAVRGLLLGGPVATQVGWTFAWIAGLIVVFFPLALRGYIRRA